MKVKPLFCTLVVSLSLLLSVGCSTGRELTEWAAGKANDALEVVGGGVQEVIDDLHDAEYQGGPFENNLESARAYLLEQMQKKYGIEFTVVGDEDLENYGPFAGATYTCKAAPVDRDSTCISNKISGCPGQLRCVLFQRRSRGPSNPALF